MENKRLEISRADAELMQQALSKEPEPNTALTDLFQRRQHAYPTATGLELIKMLQEAFEDGYKSYKTPAAAYNDIESAWEESETKTQCDKILAEIENQNRCPY